MLKENIIFAIIKQRFAFIQLMHVVYVQKMVLTVHLHIAHKIYDSRSLMRKKFKMVLFWIQKIAIEQVLLLKIQFGKVLYKLFYKNLIINAIFVKQHFFLINSNAQVHIYEIIRIF